MLLKYKSYWIILAGITVLSGFLLWILVFTNIWNQPKPTNINLIATETYQSFPIASPLAPTIQDTQSAKIVKRKIGNIEVELLVLSQPKVYPGFSMENALDNNPNDDYVAAFATDPLPQSFSIGINPPVLIDAVKFIWESSINYAVNYTIEGVTEDGKTVILATLNGASGQKQDVQFDHYSSLKIKSVTVIITKFAGQPRLLLREVELINNAGSQVVATQLPSLDSTKVDAKLAIIDRSHSDPELPTGQCIPSFILLSSLKNYLAEDLHGVDAEGVVVTNYGGVIGQQYNPYGIGLIGMAGFNAWCEDHDKTGLKAGLIQADWLVSHLIDKSQFGTWLYQFPNELYFAPSGWTSSLGNAFGMACLVQAYLLTNDQRYRQAAEKVIPSYNIDISKGGVRSTLPDNKDAFFEEVAYPSKTPGHILNAHVFALQSLYYAATYLQNHLANKLLLQGLKTLKDTGSEFDASVITLYALNSAEGPVSSSRLHYGHYVHMEGMYWAYQKTQDPTFLKYAFRWTNMTKKPYDMEEFLGCLNCKSVENYPTGNILYLPSDTTDVYFDLNSPQDIRSFGYNALGPFPVDYDISFSNDGSTWFNPIVVENYTKPDNLIKIDDITARYLRLSWKKLSAIPGSTLRFGVFRVDGPDYWDKPIVIAGEGDGHLLANSTQAIGYLTDGSTNTAIYFDPPSKIFADLRKPQSGGTFIIDGRTDIIHPYSLNIHIVSSSDMSHWSPLLDKSIKLDGDFHQEFHLPADQGVWQYLRLDLSGPGGFYLSEVKISP